MICNTHGLHCKGCWALNISIIHKVWQYNNFLALPKENHLSKMLKSYTSNEKPVYSFLVMQPSHISNHVSLWLTLCCWSPHHSISHINVCLNYGGIFWRWRTTRWKMWGILIAAPIAPSLLLQWLHFCFRL